MNQVSPKMSNEKISIREVVEEVPDEEDLVFKYLAPLTTSMKILGLYFTKSKSDRDLPRLTDVSRIHSLVMLIVLWLNVLRVLTVFTPQDRLAETLLWKLTIVLWMFICALAYTACYRACSSGKLNHLFATFGKRLPPGCFIRVQRTVIVYAAICWVWIVVNVVLAAYVMFSTSPNAIDEMLAPISTITGYPDRRSLFAVRICYLLLYCYLHGCSVFPIALSFLLSLIFYHEFHTCNRNIRAAIASRICLKEQFERFRRQHQFLCRLANKADKFICLSNGAYVVGMIGLVILNLYNLLWSPVISSNPIYLFMSIFWLIWSVATLAIVAAGGIMINQAAHKIYERIHDIDLSILDAETIGQVNTFLNRLCGAPIGFTVLRIFVIDRNTILTILGLLITYFLLIVQLVPPSSVSPAIDPSLGQRNINCTSP